MTPVPVPRREGVSMKRAPFLYSSAKKKSFVNKNDHEVRGEEKREELTCTKDDALFRIPWSQSPQ